MKTIVSSSWRVVAFSKYFTLGDTGKMLATFWKYQCPKLRISTESIVISKSRQASPAPEHDASGHNRHYSYYPIIDTHSILHQPALINYFTPIAFSCIQVLYIYWRYLLLDCLHLHSVLSNSRLEMDNMKTAQLTPRPQTSSGAATFLL